MKPSRRSRYTLAAVLAVACAAATSCSPSHVTAPGAATTQVADRMAALRQQPVPSRPFAEVWYDANPYFTHVRAVDVSQRPGRIDVRATFAGPARGPFRWELSIDNARDRQLFMGPQYGDVASYFDGSTVRPEGVYEVDDAGGTLTVHYTGNVDMRATRWALYLYAAGGATGAWEGLVKPAAPR
jgi:hypothetical protein